MRASKPYRPRKYAIFKHLISPEECDINLVTLKKVLNHMRSYRYSDKNIVDGIVHLSKTVDCETSAAILKLCNSDYLQLRKDCDLLYILETKYFDLIRSGDKKIEPVKVKIDPVKLSDHFLRHWRILIVSADEEYVLQYGKRIDMKSDSGGYDALLYADASECTLAERIESIIVSTNRLCESGIVIVMPEVYRNLPHTGATVEFALNLAGCIVEVPTAKSKYIFATKY